METNLCSYYNENRIKTIIPLFNMIRPLHIIAMWGWSWIYHTREKDMYYKACKKKQWNQTKYKPIAINRILKYVWHKNKISIYRYMYQFKYALHTVGEAPLKLCLLLHCMKLSVLDAPFSLLRSLLK